MTDDDSRYGTASAKRLSSSKTFCTISLDLQIEQDPFELILTQIENDPSIEAAFNDENDIAEEEEIRLEDLEIHDERLHDEYPPVDETEEEQIGDLGRQQ